ncbi:MAG TPA: response regulator, partial [Erysipelothrix sp.]
MYNVLLVDDEYMILSGLERLINWDELNLKLVGKANDGQAALDFVKNNPVDIVITDVSMPEMTGIDFIRASQQEGINFYFIIFSGYQEFEYVKDGINLGAENFLLKPINKDELNTTLANTVRKLEQEQERVKNQRLIFANTLYQWVNDDLDMVNLKRRLHDFDIVLREDDLFTAMIVVGVKEEQREDFRKLLNDLGQNLNFFIDERLTIIVRGGERELDLIQAEMNKMK